MDHLIRALHIDHCEADRALVQDALTNEGTGFQIDQASTIPEAVKHLADNVYDIVLSDFNMPILSGLDVIDLAHEKCPDVPLIIITAAGSENVAVEAMKRGAADYVVKTPENIRLLAQTIQTAMERKNLQMSSLQSQIRVQQSQRRYENIFNDSPVPLWEEDFSELYLFFQELEQRGIKDIRKYLDDNPDELSVCAKKIKVLDLNKAVLELHQADNKTLLIKKFDKIIRAQTYHMFKEEIIALAGGELEFESEAEVITLDGSPRDIYLRLIVYPEANGSYRALLATTDLTQRKDDENSRDLLMSAMEATRESVVITDRQGVIQYVNPAFEKITGYSRTEAIGKNPNILKSGQHDRYFYKEMWDTLLEGNTWDGQIINRNKEGHLFTEEATVSPVRDLSGKIVSFVGVKHDVTAEIFLESQLRQAQKMESIGLLAGGVAHDFNNMLSVIMGNAELALLEADPQGPIYAKLNGIKSAAKKSADLTNQLLAFARKQTIVPEVLDLNDAVEGILKMLRRLIGEDIELVWLPGPGMSLVKMDPSQIDQILANLCVNARDAIRGVGKLTVETSFVTISEGDMAHHPEFFPGKFVMLSVSDNGRGMDKEILERIFEPFFSTKDLGEGTGLGLATVYGIIKQNGGFIYSYSEPGQGTTFSIYLPREMDAALDKMDEQRNFSVRGGKETILVVEDEPAILALVTRILKGKGYTVWQETDPVAAISMIEKQPDVVDLLLTDVILPKLSGDDLVKQLKQISPKTKHIFMSGYSANMIASKGILEKGVPFLQKPFAKHDLESKVREILDRDQII